MTSLNLPLRTDGPDPLPPAARRERPQRPVPRRGSSKRRVDAADAALLAHWTRSALADDQELPVDADASRDAIATSGWFDSTWELSKGLEISEVPMSAELPLDGWLQFYLAS